jgi:spore maturation protein CgeB
MRIVYAGAESGTCLSRLQALRTLESDVHFFPVDHYLAGASRWQRFWERAYFRGPRLARANRELVDLCSTTKPDVVWVDKSTWVWPETLEALKSQGIFLVHHFTDAIHQRNLKMRWLFHLLRRSLPIYHVNFTSNIDDVAELQFSGAATVFLTYLAFDHNRFTNTPLSESDARTWATDVIFVGHHEKRTETFIAALLDAGVQTKVYGWGWARSAVAKRHPSAIAHRMLSDEEYDKAIKAAKIGFCCVSEINYNQTAARSYEIPASGTFLLASRSPQHQEDYEEGVEAEFYSTPEECVRKAKHYLAHPEERMAIAMAGHARCTTSDYSWARYMRDDWGRAKRCFERWKQTGGR